MLPSSPEAALLGRFGDVPIGYYTGTAEISIPLYTIKEAGLEIPISLNYHSSGIKVDDQASNVGLGWLLEPGGAIIQVINGVEDNMDNLVTDDPAGYQFLKNNISITGVHSSRTEIGEAVWQCWPDEPAPGDSPVTLNRILQGRGQPDIYQYHFPGGYSGKFYINPENQEIVLIDKKKEISVSKQYQSWIITTLDGNKFYFTAKETASSEASSEKTGYTWKLTKILLTNGREINFEYKDAAYSDFTYSETYHTEYPFNYNSMDEYFVKRNLYMTSHGVKTLVKIVTPSEIINFNLAPREDLKSGSNPDLKVGRIKLMEVLSKATGKKIKAFTFNYDYFSYTTSGGGYLSTQDPSVLNYLGKRLKLVSLHEVGYTKEGNAVSEPPYEFSYNEVEPLPLKSSFSKDFWGYYNGKNNTYLIPNLSFFYYSGYYTLMPASLLTAYTGASRIPDKVKMQTGVLKKIKYPTGGYTEFDYEANTFSNYSYPDIDKMQVVAKTVDLYDQNETYNKTSSDHFTLSRATSIHFKNTITRGYPGQGLIFDQLQGATIMLVKVRAGGNISHIKDWQMQSFDRATFDNNGGSFTWEEDVEVPYDPTAYYVVSVSLPNNLGRQDDYNKGASVRSVFTYETASNVDKSISYGGGIRVSAIRNYSQPGTITSNKLIRYVNTDNISSSGLLMSKLEPLASREMYFESHLGSVDYLATYATIWFVSSEGFVPFSSAAKGNIIGYSRVVEVETTQEGKSNGTKVYYYNNAESSTGLETPENPNLLNGTIKREEVYTNTSELISTTEYSYVNNNSLATCFMGVKAIKKFIVPPCGNTPNYFPRFTNTNYVYLFYPINSRWYLLQKKVKREFLASSELVQSEDYQYNSQGQTIKINKINSKNEKLSKAYSYSSEDNTSQGVILRSAGLLNEVLQESTLLNDNEISKIKYTFSVFNNQVALSKVEQSVYRGTSTTNITYDRYGDNKKLLQYTPYGVGSPTTILWSYNNSLPVAKIENIDYQTVQLILGAGQIQSLTNLPNPSFEYLTNLFAPLRSNVALNPMITIYTYEPLKGMLNIKDPKGEITYFDYDDFNRLKQIKDHDGNIVNSLEYHYKP